MLAEIKRYQVKNLLGEGAMAKVYEAYDPRIDRHLAIKVLRSELCVDSEYIIRFLREAKAVGALSHPHIVTVFDVDEYKSVPFIVMELLEGIPLSVLMNSGKQFTLQESISIGKQLALGLDYAHSKGIVHRDVKPSNIICAPSEVNVKITDFGIAHIDDNELTQHTRVGDLLGTPQYMSPEQLEGVKIDGRSDLFSVGVVLYQLLTGERPFAGNNVATLMYQITHIEPKPIAEYNKNIPKSLSYVVQKLLAKDPKKRYQTGKELDHALSMCLESDSKASLEQARIVPIRVKWSLLMASIVSIAMLASIAVIFNKQYHAMYEQMNEFGDSLVKFVATESAIPLLSEDWVSIELFVQEASERQNFSYLTIIDHNKIVRGASEAKLLGKPFIGTQGKPAEKQSLNIIKVFQQVFTGESSIVDYAAPVLFQSKKIGMVHLGKSQDSLQQLAEMTLYMMAILIAVTIGVVVIFSYILGRYFSQSIYVVEKSIQQIIEGRYHQRIEKHQNDEFGQLYETFNIMAETLQKNKIYHSKVRETVPHNRNALTINEPAKTRVITSGTSNTTS
ncbi:MAG: protein kinase [Thiohalomonadales bacterium]